jgi:hypothetical protein
MSEQQILQLQQSFQYALAVVLVLVLFVWYHLSGRLSMLEKKHQVTSDVLEGMCDCASGSGYSNHGIKMKGMGYLQSDRGPAGASGFGDSTSQSSGFFGGGEAPVFYDIGDVRAARTTRGWSTGYATDAAGNPVYDAAGNPVMAAKSGDYKSMAVRRGIYGKTNSVGYDTSDAKLRSLGYVQSTDPLTGKPVWGVPGLPGTEGMWTPAKEGMWSAVNTESFKSDEDLMYS